MAGVNRRLVRLEEHSRKRAKAQLRRAWANISDEEAAIVLAPYADGIREKTPAEKEMEEKMRAAMPEELIAEAIGLTESMGPEEVDRRIGVLVENLGIFQRRVGIERHLRSAKG